MSNFVIEKGIPVPETANGNGVRSPKYPFASMEIGDSIFVADKSKMNSTVAAAAQRTGFKFKFASENGGTRIWRVEGETDKRKPKAAKAG